MELFIIGYYKSFAYVTENSNDLLEKMDENAIRKMISNIFDKKYINDLCKTIIKEYDFYIIKSKEQFLISDQYISTASLNVKNQFVNSCNRAMGFKDTIILIPITTSYYIVFKNGNKFRYLQPNKINILDEEQAESINKVIFRNSYLKVAGNNETNLLKTYENCKKYNLDRVQCLESNFFYNNKKEVFLMIRIMRFLTCIEN